MLFPMEQSEGPIPQEELWGNSVLVQDTLNAFNLLRLRPGSGIDGDHWYRLTLDSRGRKRVVLWKVSETTRQFIPGSVFSVDPLDLIHAAGRLALVRGQSDSL